MTQQLCREITSSYCVNFSLPISDACKNVPCPLQAGNLHNLSLTLPVSNSYPSVSLAKGY